MRRQERENGEKAGLAGKVSRFAGALAEPVGNSLPEADITGAIQEETRTETGSSPHSIELAVFLGRPGIWRRGRFVIERLFELLADNWRRDCERRNAPFLWAAVAFAAGAAVYLSLPDEPDIVVILLVVIALGFWTFQRLHAGRQAFVSVIGMMVFAGVLASTFHGQRLTGPVLQQEISARIVGRLLRVEHRPKDERWLIEVETIDKLMPNEAPHRLLLTRRNLQGRYQAGERLEMRARLIPLARPVFPGSFDYGRYLWARGIGAQGYLGKSIKRLEEREGAGGQSTMAVARHLIERQREGLATALLQRLEGEAAGLSVALSVGKRDYLSEGVKEALRQSGLAHILAISGLHMAVVAMTVFGGLRALFALSSTFALRYPIKKWAALGALFVASGYLLLSGWGVSTIRAYVMTAIFLGSILMGRPALTLHNLALAMLVLVIWQPYAVVEAGFQMSFAATAALIAVYDRMRHWREHKSKDVSILDLGGRRIVQWIGGVGVTAFVAGVAVLPFSLTHFQQVAPLSLLANLLAMPVFSLIVVPFALLSVLFAPLGLQALPLMGVEWGLETIIAIAFWISAQSPQDLLLAAGHWSLPILAVMALAFFTIHRGVLAFLGGAMALIFLPFILLVEPPDIWISQKGNLVALRDLSGQWQFVGKKRPSFEAFQLLRGDGDSRALNGGSNLDYVGKCGRAGCRYEGQTRQEGLALPLSISVVLHPSAFAEDCVRNDIVVTPLSLPHICNGPILRLDQASLEAGGARFGWLQSVQRESLRVTATGEGAKNQRWEVSLMEASVRGRRPWQLERPDQ